MKAGIIDKLATLAKRRKLEDLTATPILTWTNKQIEEHIQNCLAIPGAKILFGGKPLANHTIPECYGAYEPTAVFIPLQQIHDNTKHFNVATTELFGPFQVITEYKDNEADKVPSYFIFRKGDCNLRANGIALDCSGSQQQSKLLG